jgi:hypothetical protein
MAGALIECEARWLHIAATAKSKLANTPDFRVRLAYNDPPMPRATVKERCQTRKDVDAVKSIRKVSKYWVAANMESELSLNAGRYRPGI